MSGNSRSFAITGIPVNDMLFALPEKDAAVFFKMFY